MRLLKKLPAAVVVIGAALVFIFIVSTLIGHLQSVSRIEEQKARIQEAQVEISRNQEYPS